jgi:hypothetical protein
MAAHPLRVEDYIFKAMEHGFGQFWMLAEIFQQWCWDVEFEHLWVEHDIRAT